MYTVVIIEDDPMITRLNRRYVEQDSRFAVVQTFSAAHPALFWLQRNPIDLIILDVYMPQMSGTELLMQLRAKGVDADVIMVTSANDAKTVNDAVRLGAVDYLVKPFAYERFQQALEVFCRRRESVQRDSFSQDALDHTLFRQTAPAPSAAPPKGLQSQTLARIEAYLRAAPDERHTSDEIASHVGLSVVTVRPVHELSDRPADHRQRNGLPHRRPAVSGVFSAAVSGRSAQIFWLVCSAYHSLKQHLDGTALPFSVCTQRLSQTEGYSLAQELHFLVVLHLVRVVLEWADIRDGNGCNKI